jgi:LysM repeat protein
MKNEFREDSPVSPGAQVENGETPSAQSEEKGLLSRWTEALLQMGLGESLLRAGSSALSLIVIAAVVWLAQIFFKQPAAPQANAAAAGGPAAAPIMDMEAVPAAINLEYEGIPRIALPFTVIPSRPRQQITKYVVQEGDTVFAIAEKYGLQPQTVLWGNYDILLDDPHALQSGQELNILPSDGVYWEWVKENKGGLVGFAEYFGANVEDIINSPVNNLDPATIGDYANPNIPDGTWLFVPGGKREFVSWSAPLGVTREDPATARVLGAGACDPVVGGAVGYGAFVWPSNKHYLSGYDYSPKSNHWGIDIAGSEGEGVYAVDAGVIVYSGWNNYGYGNMLIVDHGNGWQSLYAHLSAIYRFCGQSVGQGEAIGAIGSTGRSSGAHLHFELMTPTFKVNPWDFLPAP